MPSFITYESFGAVGDGQIDDLPAIVKARQEANRLHLPVKAKAGATYYLSPRDLTATVETSVDWTGAHFIIDDVGCENLSAPIFHVASAMKPLPLAVSSMVDMDSGVFFIVESFQLLIDFNPAILLTNGEGIGSCALAILR